jgi:hypothetical protein
MLVRDLIAALQELAPDWEIAATTSGRSLEFHDSADDRFWASGHKYGYVFTDGRRHPIQHLTRR